MLMVDTIWTAPDGAPYRSDSSLVRPKPWRMIFLKFVNAPLGIWRVSEKRKQSQVLQILVIVYESCVDEGTYEWIF